MLVTWREVVVHPSLVDLPFKIETNRFGQVVMSPATSWHGLYQGAIQDLIREHIDGGNVAQECPVQTTDGVKVADVAWLSSAFLKAHLSQDVFLDAPELCIEIVSPSNSAAEMNDKRALYLAAGALEVWTCDLKGNLRFYDASGELETSSLAPGVPKLVSLG
jgi:Uma2 family endonuclease